MATVKPASAPALQRGALQRIPAPLLAIGAIVFLQISSGTVKGLITPENTMSLLFVRLSLGTVILWLGSRPPVRDLSAEQWRDAGLLGLVVAGFNMSVYVALQALPLGLVATLGFLGPLAVSLIGMRRALDALWPLLGFAGVLLLTPWAGTGTVTLAGLAAGLAYAAMWALYILASARAGRTLPGISGFVLANAAAAVLLAPVGFAGSAEFLAADKLAPVALIILFSTVPFAMEFLALKRLPPRVFGVLLSLEPGIAALVGLALLGEHLAALGWLALFLVSAGSAGATLARER